VTATKKRLKRCHPRGPTGKGEHRNVGKEAAERAKKKAEERAKKKTATESRAEQPNGSTRIRIKDPRVVAPPASTESTRSSTRIRERVEAREAQAAAAARNLSQELRAAGIVPEVEEDFGSSTAAPDDPEDEPFSTDGDISEVGAVDHTNETESSVEGNANEKNDEANDGNGGEVAVEGDEAEVNGSEQEEEKTPKHQTHQTQHSI